jgi:3-hydroxybutyryl-CoA dehydrogenase
MLASSGSEVRLYDPNADQLEVARRYVEAELPRVVAGRAGALPGRLVLSKTVQAAVAETWMIVEAIPERLDPKRKIFGDLDRLAPEDAILASNSSSYPTSQFIDAVSRPGRAANTHYYRPPDVNVVEVMSCGKTTDDVIARLLERLPAYGFFPYLVLKESVGFIYNRIWAAIKREALAVVAEGVSTPQVVDELFQSILGSSNGPFRIMDKVGLDVVLDIEEHYAAIRPGISR